MNTLPSPIVLRTLTSPPEQSRELARDAQAEARAARFPRHALIDLPERVEHALEMLAAQCRARCPTPRMQPGRRDTRAPSRTPPVVVNFTAFASRLMMI